MPSPALPAFDLTNLRDLIGLYVMVPVQKYIKFRRNENHIGWAARIAGFDKTKKKVILEVIGDPAAKHPVEGATICLMNMVRLA